LVENFLLTTFRNALEKDKECPFWDILPQKGSALPSAYPLFSKFVITSKDVHARWKRIVLGRHKTTLLSVPHQTSQFTTHIPLLTILFCAKVALISSHKYISVKLEDVICKAGLAAGFFFPFSVV